MPVAVAGPRPPVMPGIVVAPVLVALGAFLGEVRGPSPAPVPLALAAACGVGAVAAARRGARRAGALLACGALLAAGVALEQRALDGIVHWPLARATDQRADVIARGTLVDDPDGTRWSTRVLVRVDDAWLVDGRRELVGVHRTVALDAESEAAGRVAILGAGDHVVVRGWLRPLDGFDTRLRWKHVVAQLTATELVDASRADAPLSVFADRARGIVLRGTDALPPVERALTAGFLLGDTRDLPDPVVDRFRDAGLSHLLAVSGANVAFVLALVGPVLRRLPRSARLGVALGVLVGFGAMTRWEPSVLRAGAMAAAALVALHVGRPAGGVRVLALAVTGLLLVDPFLVHSVGFLLSVGASLGIALLAVPIARRLRGPAWLRESLATTVAAQVGVAPVLVPVFGSLPLVAVPANLLAAPLVGPLTMWGLVAGTVAGLVRVRLPAVAGALQWPTRLLADAVLGIADGAGRVPVSVGPGPIVAAALVSGAMVGRRRRMLRRRAVVLPSR